MNVCLKRFVSLAFFLICSSIILLAQNGERRVYYLDATYSMVTNKMPSGGGSLWEGSKKNLINAINNVSDINTELVVVVFSDDKSSSRNVWKRWETKATDAGKEDLKNKINGLGLPVKSTMTNLHRPLASFYSEAKSNKVNYMFLMTDGEHEVGGDFVGELKKWQDKTGELTYGFFVELTKIDGPKVEAARNAIDTQERLWRVSTADVDINLVRLGNKVQYNVRNDDYIDIPVFFSGKKKSIIKDVDFAIAGNSDVSIKKIDSSDDNIRVYLKRSNVDLSSYPEKSSFTLNASLKNSDEMSFLLTSKVKVTCLNQKERVLKLSENKVSGKVYHYDSFGLVRGKTTPYKFHVDLDWSQDAIGDKGTFASLTFVDNEGKKLGKNDAVFSCETKLVPSMDGLDVEVTFPEGAKYGKYQGEIKLANYKLDRIGNEVLDGSPATALVWQVRYAHRMNPLAQILMWLIILLVAMALIWFLIVKPAKYPRFPRFRKSVLVKQNNAVIDNFTTDFKGARRVVFTNTKVKQSFLNKVFTGEIRSVVRPEFDQPITFIPRRGRKAMVRGNGYVVMPNPLQQSGTATITNVIKKLIINLQ